MVGTGGDGLLYRDEDWDRRLRTMRWAAFVVALIFAGMVTLLYLLLADAYAPPLLAVAAISAGFVAPLLWYMAVERGPILVSRDAVHLPRRWEPGQGRLPLRVPTSEVHRVYCDPSRPLTGVKLFLRDGTVRHLGPTDLSDPAAFVDALSGTTYVTQEDAESRELLDRLDILPTAYAALWTPGPPPGMALFVGFVTFVAVVLLLGGTRDLMAEGLDRSTFLLLIFGVPVVAGATYLVYGRTVRPTAMWRLRLIDTVGGEGRFPFGKVDGDPVYGLIEGFLEQEGIQHVLKEEGSTLVPRRVYALPGLHGLLRVEYRPQGRWEAGGWHVTFSHPRGEAREATLRNALGRFALREGLISSKAARVRRLERSLSLS
jgi:hypothetical protein